VKGRKRKRRQYIMKEKVRKIAKGKQKSKNNRKS
jgi:hypothetical protein